MFVEHWYRDIFINKVQQNELYREEQQHFDLEVLEYDILYVYKIKQKKKKYEVIILIWLRYVLLVY